MFSVMIETLLCQSHCRSFPQWLSCIEIPVILGKSAGRDLQADAMTNFKGLSSVPTINRIMIDASRFNQRRVLHAITEARPHHTITETQAEAIGPDINKLGHKVSIGS